MTQPTTSPTPGPTGSPVSPPTTSPTFLVDKYICHKNNPGGAEICLNGSVLDATCPAPGASCGNGGKICHVEVCSASGAPSPTPPPVPPAPTPPGGCAGAGESCADTPCCSGNCPGGKPSTRFCPTVDEETT